MNAGVFVLVRGCVGVFVDHAGFEAKRVKLSPTHKKIASKHTRGTPRRRAVPAAHDSGARSVVPMHMGSQSG